MYNHSRVCYFGLAKPVWPSGVLQGDRQKVNGTMRNGTRCPSLCPQPSLPVHPDRLEAQHLWQVGILVLSCSENKNKCSSFLWGVGRGQTEPPRFPQRGFSGEERRSSVPCQGFELRRATHWAFLLDLVCTSRAGEIASAS